jgi:hypothetical protein
MPGDGSVNHIPYKEKGELTNIARTQKSHLQDTLVPMKPAAVGPRAGPAKGATVKTARAFPRMPAFHISDIIALKIVISPRP